MPNGVHNGSLVQGDRRNAIVEAIAHGQSIASICKQVHCSPSVVIAIRKDEWKRVESRKSVLAAQTERIATLAADRLTQELESNRPINPTALVPIYGVAIDKLLALRGDNVSTVRHLHSVELSDTDLVAFAVARSKTANARVIDAQPALHDQPTAGDNATVDSIATGKVGAAKAKRRSKRSAMDSKSTVSPGKT